MSLPKAMPIEDVRVEFIAHCLMNPYDAPRLVSPGLTYHRLPGNAAFTIYTKAPLSASGLLEQAVSVMRTAHNILSVSEFNGYAKSGGRVTFHYKQPRREGHWWHVQADDATRLIMCEPDYEYVPRPEDESGRPRVDLFSFPSEARMEGVTDLTFVA